MLKSLLQAIAGRCPTHHRASAYTIAELEVATGIDPDAMAKHQAQADSFTEAYCNPRIIDCRHRACRRT
jgi:hypothetical protein